MSIPAFVSTHACSLLVAVLAWAGVGGCVSVTRQSLNVEPICAAVNGPIDTLRDEFRSYEVFAEGGMHRSGGRQPDGIVEFRARDFESPAGTTFPWTVRATICLMEDEKAASAYVATACSIMNSSWDVSLGDEDYRTSCGRFAGIVCLTPVVQLRNDPEGGSLPSRTRFSEVWIQRSNVVIQLVETRQGTQETAKQRVVDAIAEQIAGIRSHGNR